MESKQSVDKGVFVESDHGVAMRRVTYVYVCVCIDTKQDGCESVPLFVHCDTVVAAAAPVVDIVGAMAFVLHDHSPSCWVLSVLVVNAVYIHMVFDLFQHGGEAFGDACVHTEALVGFHRRIGFDKCKYIYIFHVWVHHPYSPSGVMLALP